MVVGNVHPFIQFASYRETTRRRNLVDRSLTGFEVAAFFAGVGAGAGAGAAAASLEEVQPMMMNYESTLLERRLQVASMCIFR